MTTVPYAREHLLDVLRFVHLTYGAWKAIKTILKRLKPDLIGKCMPFWTVVSAMQGASWWSRDTQIRLYHS